jgi:hypothetical protein
MAGRPLEITLGIEFLPLFAISQHPIGQRRREKVSLGARRGSVEHFLPAMVEAGRVIDTFWPAPGLSRRRPNQGLR